MLNECVYASEKIRSASRGKERREYVTAYYYKSRRRRDVGGAGGGGERLTLARLVSSFGRSDAAERRLGGVATQQPLNHSMLCKTSSHSKVDVNAAYAGVANAIAV